MRPLDAASSIRRPLPLTPLTGVVFLSLMLFMIAFVFQNEGEIEIPAAGLRAPPDGSIRPVLVRLYADGRMDVNGHTAVADDQGQATASLTHWSERLAGAVLQVRQATEVRTVVKARASGARTYSLWPW